LVKLGRRELRVIRVVSTYEVNKTEEGFVGTAWKLQLDDYRRIVVVRAGTLASGSLSTTSPLQVRPRFGVEMSLRRPPENAR
jgi:hypothetical protein